ncbi:MAG TPA: polysaccharide biosynthesis/export family protein [Cyclobacteriaceae bacterium]|nr:polysaccharide biosynthesis/export family protein [Cyclobacteriaceae bacterium]
MHCRKLSLYIKHCCTNLIIVAVLSGTLFSCVTNRKYQLMQKGDVNQSNLKTDTVLRKYQPEQFQYRLQTNDIVSVRFESVTPKEFDFLSNQSNQNNIGGQIAGVLLLGDLIDENGEIPFPVVGKVKIGGLTVFKAQDTLQMIANRYLESPIVKVRLLNYRATFLGEVNKEGVVALQFNRVTMLEALGHAGGLTDLADKTNIKLIRQKGNSVEVVYLNLLDENFVNSPYYYIYQNDILVVPALKQRPYRKYFGQNLALVLSSFSILLLALNYTK